MTTKTSTITRSLVSESERLSILPRYFKGYYLMIADSTVFSYMGKINEEYQGGHWDYYTLSNGGFYMVPSDSEGSMVNVETENQYAGFMSADAAALVACLYAFNYLCNASEDDAAIELFHQVRDYAVQHPESQKILSAID